MLDYLKNKLVVGRGATAIYLLLKAKFSDAEVVAPANICYSAIYPIIYSGNKPAFCDVDANYGNLTLKSLETAVSHKTKAIIAPHMYGNPIIDIDQISLFCKQMGIMLIEDCASAMGAEINGRKVGTFGEYVIFSTGYAKTIDLGNGGILASNKSLDEETKIYHELPLYDENINLLNTRFSKEYRAFRNSKNEITNTNFYQLCHSDLFKNFIYRVPESFVNTLRKKIENELESTIIRRRNSNSLYSSLVEYCDIVKPYEFIDGSVPWRFNILVSPDIRDVFVQKLLEKYIPVSDWYPVSSILFDDYSTYRNALNAEKSILNFPLLIGEKDIKTICCSINDIKNEIAKKIN